jgi:hypothetical protein
MTPAVAAYRSWQRSRGEEETCAAPLYLSEPGLTIASWACRRPIDHAGTHEATADGDDGLHDEDGRAAPVLLRWDDHDGARGWDL